ncbi:hypothetical protein PG996_004830 [Apiospora saccharicola]|uniref:DUF1918 domain-containing protein n=1 Tax=Apiospora saccharicola TaxID=335842 RepID=A0ABR1W5A3_9PEZI
MDSSSGRRSPDFTIDDDSGKGKIRRGASARKFAIGDSVYLKVAGGREGPYMIETCDGSQYTLCLTDGTSAKGGQKVAEDDLERA